MLDHSLESSRWNDSNKWSSIWFGKEVSNLEIQIHILSGALNCPVITKEYTSIFKLAPTCLRMFSAMSLMGDVELPSILTACIYTGVQCEQTQNPAVPEMLANIWGCIPEASLKRMNTWGWIANWCLEDAEGKAIIFFKEASLNILRGSGILSAMHRLSFFQTKSQECLTKNLMQTMNFNIFATSCMLQIIIKIGSTLLM